MVNIRLSEIKPWLRNSIVYRTYIEDKKDLSKTVPIEKRYYYDTPLFSKWQEVSKTLRVCNFWDVDYIPVGVVKFIFNCDNQEEIDKIISNNEYYTDKISNILKLEKLTFLN